MKIIAIILFIVWVLSLISLCSRRDIDAHTKISWVVTLLILNGLGALIYLFWGPKTAKQKVIRPDVPKAPDDAEPIDLDSFPSSWNPYTGSNYFKEGESLNPPPSDHQNKEDI